LLAVDVVTRGSETYPSPFAYQLTIMVIIGLCLVAILVAFALPKNLKSKETT